MNNDIDGFCRNYKIKVLNDTGQHVEYYRPAYFTMPYDASVVELETKFCTERLYTITIPESQLTSLMNIEQKFFNAGSFRSTRPSTFADFAERDRTEFNLRQTNSAIYNAYQQYSMLLNLAGCDTNHNSRVRNR